MIPIRDDATRRRAPVAVSLVVAVNTLIFVHELLLPGVAFERFVMHYGLVPRALRHAFFLLCTRPADPGASLLPLLSYQFLHGGWLHFLGNMWALWLFGATVEERLGPVRFLGFYLTGGILAGLVQCATHWNSGVPTIGASGAIAAVFGAYFLLFPKTWVTVLAPILPFLWLPVKLPALLVLGLWILSQAAGAVHPQPGTENIAFWAHLGGFAAGLFLVRNRPFRPGVRVRRRPGRAKRK